MGELCPGVCITPEAMLYDTVANNIEHPFNIITTKSIKVNDSLERSIEYHCVTVKRVLYELSDKI